MFVQPVAIELIIKCMIVTGCGHTNLAATVNYSSQVLYEGCTPEKKAQIIMLKNLEYIVAGLAATE